jgi:putative inorganic carbon (HCO3(-)) transporter
MIIPIILFLALFTILAWKKLDWALLLIIATLPSYLLRFQIAGIPLTLLEGMILIAFGVWVIAKDGLKLKGLFKKENRRAYPYRFEIIIMLILAWVGIIVAGLKPEAFGVFKAYFIEPILLFILIINRLRDEAGQRKIIYALTISALAVSLLAIYQKVTGQFIDNPFWAAIETRRAVSFFGYPNAVGLFLAPLVMLMTGQLFKSHKLKEKIFFILTIIASILAIYFAKSEGALIGLLAAGFICALLINKKLRVTAIILAIIGITAIFSFAPLRTFIISKITLSDLSGQIRQQQWIETKKMFAAGHFWQGAGLSNYQETVAPYHQEGIFLKNGDPNWLEKIRTSEDFRKQMWQPTEIYMYPHNIFLNFWSELGLLGALLFSWIIAKFLWQSSTLYLKQKDFLALGLCGAMLVILVHGLVDVPYFKNDLSVLFWILIALLGSLRLNAKTKI